MSTDHQWPYSHTQELFSVLVCGHPMFKVNSQGEVLPQKIDVRDGLLLQSNGLYPPIVS